MVMPRSNLLKFWLCTVAFILLLGECLGQDSSQSSGRRRNTRNRNRGNNRGLPSDVQELHSVAQSRAGSSTAAPSGQRSPNWLDWAPSRPASGEVECFVEIFRTETLGGVCIRTGGSGTHVWCQSGVHLGYYPDCRNIISERERPTGMGNGGQGRPRP